MQRQRRSFDGHTGATRPSIVDTRAPAPLPMSLATAHTQRDRSGGERLANGGVWTVESPPRARADSNPPSINALDVVLSDEIGRGSYGTVHRGMWIGLPVAVKVLHAGVSDSVRHEMEALARVPFHRNVLRLHGFVQLPGRGDCLVRVCTTRW